MINVDIIKTGLTLLSDDTSLGQACYENIVKTLSTLLDAEFAFIGLFNKQRHDIETIAVCENGKIIPNIKYDLHGTPCENVVSNEMCFYGEGVDKLFPTDLMLGEMGVSGYLGAPIFNLQSKIIGLIVLLSKKPMVESSDKKSLVQLCAARAGAEIVRSDYEARLKKINEELEIQVRERTSQLESMTESMSESLHESEEKYRVLFENNTDALVMHDPEKLGFFMAANKSAAVLFGAKTAEELMAYGPMDLSPEFQPDGRSSIEKAFEMAAIATREGSNTFDWKHKKISGELFDCNIVLTGISLKGKRLIQASMRDITESKRSKEMLLQKEKELEYAEQVAKLGRWKWDVLSDKVEWSMVVKEIYGLDPKDEVPNFKDFARLYQPESLARLREKVANLLENGVPYNVDTEIIRSDGITRWVHASGDIAERNSSGKIIKLAGTIQDIDDRKRLENNLQKALEVRDNFLGVASHELKTPLTTLQIQINSLIKIFSGSLEHVQLDKIRSKLLSIKRQGDRFEQLVKTLLDVSQITSGKLKPHIIPNTNLSQLIEEVASRFEDEFLSVGSILITIIEPGIVGDFDPQGVDQVISNLLTNAIKYGGGKPVEVILKKTDSQVDIAVCDQGIGIGSEAQTKIFERYERAVDEHNYKGFGLGLWIVKEIVATHSGKIVVESELGKGSCFRVILPIRTGRNNE
jgi:PAS domain S-box-containing protein